MNISTSFVGSSLSRDLRLLGPTYVHNFSQGHKHNKVSAEKLRCSDDPHLRRCHHLIHLHTIKRRLRRRPLLDRLHPVNSLRRQVRYHPQGCQVPVPWGMLLAVPRASEACRPPLTFLGMRTSSFWGSTALVGHLTSCISRLRRRMTMT